MKKYSIESQAIRAWGTTNIPEFCVWMTREGTMINGSLGGHQRDRDHREIADFFKKSKFEDPGSSWCYVKKFMRRGNIRMGCSNICYYMEICGTPSDAQLCLIRQIHHLAEENRIEFGIGYRSPRNFGKVIQFGYEEFLCYLERYAKAA